MFLRSRRGGMKDWTCIGRFFKLKGQGRPFGPWIYFMRWQGASILFSLNDGLSANYNNNNTNHIFLVHNSANKPLKLFYSFFRFPGSPSSSWSEAWEARLVGAQPPHLVLHTRRKTTELLIRFLTGKMRESFNLKLT